MRQIVLNVKDRFWGSEAARILRQDERNNYQVELVKTPEEAKEQGKIASILLLGVTGCYPGYSLKERLKLRDEVKAVNPDCKVVLMVDENSEKELADEVCRAKKDGLIDNFIYGSVSATYLSAVIDTL